MLALSNVNLWYNTIIYINNEDMLNDLLKSLILVVQLYHCITAWKCDTFNKSTPTWKVWNENKYVPETWLFFISFIFIDHEDFSQSFESSGRNIPCTLDQVFATNQIDNWRDPCVNHGHDIYCQGEVISADNKNNDISYNIYKPC